MALSTVEHCTTDLDAEVAALRDRIAGGPRLPLSEPVLDEAAARQAAAKAVADLVDAKTMDAVLEQIKVTRCG
jgi:putative transposase